MDPFFANGLYNLFLFVIMPIVLAVSGIKGRHGMTVMVSIGIPYTLFTLLMGHVFCALVYSFCIISYLVYRADKYVDEMKARKFTYEKFKDYIDLDFSDVEELFTNIFGETDKIDNRAKYEREFNKYFDNRSYGGRYTSQRFNTSNSQRFDSRQGRQSNTSRQGYQSNTSRQGYQSNTSSQRVDYSQQSRPNNSSQNNNTEGINQEAVALGLRYYAKCMTVEDAKKAYRKYAVTFHPDNPVTGDEDKFVEIDKQYNKFVETFGGR